MKLFFLEYAQFHNGQFVAWIDGGEFKTAEAARKAASDRGLTVEGEDYLVTEDTYIFEDERERGLGSLWDL